MPRDGTETYILPFPDVVADTTIESAVYNNFTNDVAQDLNAPRPITAGGTGATSAAGALVALGGETASQVVTNYDSYVFKAGSFYSAAGATAAPNAHAFTGICYLSDANNITIEARDATDGELFIRRKVAGVWTAWVSDDADTDAKVAKAGDIMTGPLELPMAAPTLGVYAANKTYVDNQLAIATLAEVTRADAAYQAKDPQLFAGMPLVNVGGTYTTIAADAQKCIYGTAAITINNALAYPSGTVITFLAWGGGATVLLSSGVMYWFNGSIVVTGTRTLTTTGAIATAIKIGPDWVIYGHGVS